MAPGRRRWHAGGSEPALVIARSEMVSKVEVAMTARVVSGVSGAAPCRHLAFPS